MKSNKPTNLFIFICEYIVIVSLFINKLGLR